MTTIAEPGAAAAPGTKHIYRFDEGSAEMRDLLGGKGANLCEMSRLGLPVPPGFVITTETCREFRPKHFDGNGAAVLQVLSVEDQCHPALAELAFDAVSVCQGGPQTYQYLGQKATRGRGRLV